MSGLTGGTIGDIFHIVASPTDTHVAIANHRLELILCEVGGEGKKWGYKVVDSNKFSEIEDIAWSPNGKWLAYAYHTNPVNRVIKLLNVKSGESCEVTHGRFDHSEPDFDPGAITLTDRSLLIHHPTGD